jgi:hypothetical protein
MAPYFGGELIPEMSAIETAEERFKRLATARTNEILRRLKILGNCANRQVYSYSEKDVEKIFSAIEKRLKEVRAKFYPAREERFHL